MIEQQQLRHRIAVAAKLVDPTGVLRLKLNLSDVITPNEIRVMDEHMRKQNLVASVSLG